MRISYTLSRYIFWDLLRIFLMASGALAGIMSFGGLLRPLTQQGLDAPRLEGTDYFGLSWSHQPRFLAGWFGTWGIWQILGVGAILSRTRPPSASGVTDEA